MSSSDVDDSGRSAAPAPPASTAASPVLLGLPCAVIGVLALGLFLLGYAPQGAAGAVVPLFAGLGISLLMAARWAMSTGAGPDAAIFGLFGGFFVSFALLHVGFVHNWFGTRPPGSDDDAALIDTFSVYALCWAIVTTVLVLGSLRLPLSLVVILVFSDLVFILVWLAFVTATFATQGVLRTLAGLCCLVAGATGCYVFGAALSSALGGRRLPLGRPVIS